MGGLGVGSFCSCLYFLGGWLSFGFQFKHILSGLLCIEVSLVGVLGGYMSGAPAGCSLVFFYVLGMGVCEAALGLSLLVLFARVHGNDLFKGLDSQQLG
uniref:NADH-ubiquinone oxidoreductase chain 4L n=1 Tax=Placopecten magellanicus TaxID=6577 RepID=Q4FE18_PLAMG|nr:NADH dehydrogenase subunit 4L [Placopecten magellanicus]AAZ06447.1 NADH dehydrogenase subunit 4L [Placopecten magellanicus]